MNDDIECCGCGLTYNNNQATKILIDDGYIWATCPRCAWDTIIGDDEESLRERGRQKICDIQIPEV